MLGGGWLWSGCELLGLGGGGEFAKDAKRQAKVLENQADLEDAAEELVEQAAKLKRRRPTCRRGSTRPRSFTRPCGNRPRI